MWSRYPKNLDKDKANIVNIAQPRVTRLVKGKEDREKDNINNSVLLGTLF